MPQNPAMAEPSPVVIIGAGYTGARLARRLAPFGAAIWLTRSTATATAALAAELPDLQVVTLRLPLAADDRVVRALPRDAIWVVLAPPVDEQGEAEATLLAAAVAPRRIVYVSSTGVYGPAAGAWVDDTAPLAPAGASGRARVAAEASVRAHAGEWCILRPAGIYGPGRGLLARLRAGTMRIVGNGSTMVSRIHVDDLVTAIDHAMHLDAARARVFNVADDEPTPTGALADQLAMQLGLPSPPRVPVAEVTPEVAAMLTADRRIRNTALRRDLEVVLRYPTWREGLAEELAAPT